MKFDELMSVDETADIYGCTRARVYQLINEGRLKPVIDKPRTKLFLRDDVERIARQVIPRRRRKGRPLA